MRFESIVKKAKIQANDLSGRKATNDFWNEFFKEALTELNREFKFKFKSIDIDVTKLQPVSLPSDFLVIKSVYNKANMTPLKLLSFDNLIRRAEDVFYFYAIEGNKIWTNINGTITVYYYSSDVTIDDVPAVFDQLIVDYLVWKFYKTFYPELEESYYVIYERNKLKLRQDILNLETEL